MTRLDSASRPACGRRKSCPASADRDPAIHGGGDADLAAELVGHPHLALGDAVDLGLVQGVDHALGPSRKSHRIDGRNQSEAPIIVDQNSPSLCLNISGPS